MNKISIRPLNKGDSITELTDLLHRSYKSLQDMGLKYVATWQDEEMTRKHVSKGDCFVATDNGKIIGTILLYGYFGDKGDVPDWYKSSDIRVFGKFAVDPEYQKQGIGSMLMVHIEEYARKLYLRELALDTAEEAKHLIDYYSKRGYRYIGNHQWSITNFRSVVMSKKL